MPMPMSEKHSSQLYLMNKLLLHAALLKKYLELNMAPL